MQGSHSPFGPETEDSYQKSFGDHFFLPEMRLGLSLPRFPIHFRLG
jgi:hypothetical protein